MTADPDKFLVRGAGPEGTYNLAVGEPVFLRKHLVVPQNLLVSNIGGSDYPPYKGLPRLLEELGWMYPGKHVVVTTGAKQALLAAFYAYRQRFGKQAVYHEAPCWPSYPTLAKLSGLSFQSDRMSLLCLTDEFFARRYISVKTAPNNPDGRVADRLDLKHYDIWDAAYAHPVYGWNPADLPSHTVSVWSAAKLLGFSGDRIGWLVTGDKELADLAADYIEKTTSGVNTKSQAIIAAVLGYIRCFPEEGRKMYEAARNDLLHNFMRFIQTFGPSVRNAKDYSGMFGWFDLPYDVGVRQEEFDALLREARVMLVPASACGVLDKPGRYRISLGHRVEVVDAALQSISEALWRRRGPLFGT